MSAARGFIAGPYYWTFNGRAFGVTEDGFNLGITNFGDAIRGDNLGDSLQDYVYRGGDVDVSGVCQEWDVAIAGVSGAGAVTNSYCASIFWPWYTLGGTGQIGRLASLVAAPLIGTPAPGTTAASASIKNLTITYAVIPPNFNSAHLFAARHRNFPIRLQALPYPILDSGSETWFTLV